MFVNNNQSVQKYPCYPDFFTVYLCIKPLSKNAQISVSSAKLIKIIQ